MRADKKEGGGRAELTTEAKATRRQGGRENGGKGAGDQSLKGGLGVGSAGGRRGRGNGRLIVPAGGSLLFPLFPWQPDRI